MSKDVIILRSGRMLIRMYDAAEAEKVAQRAAEREPGRTFEVVQIISTYRRPKTI